MAEPIRLTALRHSAFYTPYLLTVAGGFLQQQGLDPVYQPAKPGQNIEELLTSGACDVSQSAVAVSFAALEKGEQPKVKHFAQINQRDGFFITAREADSNFTWDKLIGKDVLVDHLFQPLAMLKYGLHQQGIDIKKISVIDAGNVDDMDQAFRNGRGDYVHQQGPAPQQLEHDGVGHVVASVTDLIGPVAFSSLCATEDWLHSDSARAFIEAYKKAKQAANEWQAEKIGKTLQQGGYFSEIDQAVLVHTIKTYQGLGTWSGGIEIDNETYNRLLDVFEYNGLINQRHDIGVVVVNTQ